MMIELKGRRGPSWTHYAILDRQGRDTGKRQFVQVLGQSTFQRGPFGLWVPRRISLRQKLADLASQRGILLARAAFRLQSGLILAATFESQPDAAAGIDTFMSSSNPTTNYGTNTIIQCGREGTSNNLRTLMKFNLSSIPTGAACNDAAIELYCFYYDASGRDMSMHELRSGRAGWTEGGATWNVYDGSNSWGTAGCDDTSSDRLSTAIATATVVSGWTTFDLTAADIEDWFGSSNENYGILLRETTEINWTKTQFWSSDYTTSSLRPKISVDYTVGAFMMPRRYW